MDIHSFMLIDIQTPRLRSIIRNPNLATLFWSVPMLQSLQSLWRASNEGNVFPGRLHQTHQERRAAWGQGPRFCMLVVAQGLFFSLMDIYHLYMVGQ